MIRILTLIVSVTGAWLAMPAPAEAAESYDNCTGFIDSLPARIETQGTWCLDKDLSTGITTGFAITIAANNVTLDCNHFKIGGLAAGAGTRAHAILAYTRLNATVRNCNIRGFARGIDFSVGGGHLVENNIFDRNTSIGISVASSPGSIIRKNLVINTGGSTFYGGAADGITASYGVDILDNTVDGVAPNHKEGMDAWAFGISTRLNGDGSISGNRVRGLAPTGNGAAVGIRHFESARVVVRDNDVQGPGPGVVGGVGIHCLDNTATARDNVIAGFETGIANCHSSSNVVNPN